MPLLISLLFGVPLGFGIGVIRPRFARYVTLSITAISPLLFIFAIAMLFSQGRVTGYEHVDLATVVSLFRFLTPWILVLLASYLLLGRPPRKRWEAGQDRYIP